MFGDALSPSPSQDGEYNQTFAFSPAPAGGTAPASAVGLRRLGMMPPSQLGRYAAGQEASPDGYEPMSDGEGPEGQQPPGLSLAGASPGGGAAAAAGAGRERPEEDQFAEVLRAGAQVLDMLGPSQGCMSRPGCSAAAAMPLPPMPHLPGPPPSVERMPRAPPRCQ
jgi:hypothetical protein